MNMFYFLGLAIVYGFLTLLSLYIFALILRSNWNPWFRTLALLPFIAYWIYSYEHSDEVYYHAFEEVIGVELPAKFELIHKSRSSTDEFGDYNAFAVFMVDQSIYRQVEAHIERASTKTDTSRQIPQEVSKYLRMQQGKKVANAYHLWKDGGLQLYGATLNDQKTVIVFRSSW